MTEHDWAESARTSKTMEEYQLTLLAWADWVEEQGLGYGEGLRWLSREGKFPCMNLRMMNNGEWVGWYNSYRYPHNIDQEWVVPESLFRELGSQKGHVDFYREYDDFLTSIRDVALAYQRSICSKSSSLRTSNLTVDSGWN